MHVWVNRGPILVVIIFWTTEGKNPPNVRNLAVHLIYLFILFPETKNIQIERENRKRVRDAFICPAEDRGKNSNCIFIDASILRWSLFWSFFVPWSKYYFWWFNTNQSEILSPWTILNF